MNLTELNEEVQSLRNTVEEIGCNDYVADIVCDLSDNIGNIAEELNDDYIDESEAFDNANSILEDSKDHAQSILDLINPFFVVEIALLEKIISYELTE
ncbi:hypothetical protein [Elizabethkingia anophelis]|uniref:hypothetical protein n=1 Tax=Elizabethkingia anophelis TaxID=1117645 RepID=UPI00389247B0